MVRMCSARWAAKAQYVRSCATPGSRAVERVAEDAPFNMVLVARP